MDSRFHRFQLILSELGITLKNNSCSQMERVMVLKDDELPIKFRQLVVFFDVINDIFCFLRNRDICTTVTALESVFNTFNLSNKSASAYNVSFSMESLLLLQTFDPKHVKLENQNISLCGGNNHF